MLQGHEDAAHKRRPAPDVARLSHVFTGVGWTMREVHRVAQALQWRG
jgi:hypothetical protein